MNTNHFQKVKKILTTIFYRFRLIEELVLSRRKVQELRHVLNDTRNISDEREMDLIVLISRLLGGGREVTSQEIQHVAGEIAAHKKSLDACENLLSSKLFDR